MAMGDLYSLENPVFKAFIFYGAAVIIKMFMVVFMTIFTRISKGIFSTPEDIDPKQAKDGAKPVFDDERVERKRRNHLNDMENIFPFFLLGLAYIACNPALETALWHFRIFFFSRCFHMIAYQLPLPQPSRALGFMVGFWVNISMAVQIILATI